MCVENKLVDNWQSVLGRPLLAPIHRWPGLEDPVSFDTNYNVVYDMILYFDYSYAWA
jgi:hypothetical protein